MNREKIINLFKKLNVGDSRSTEILRYPLQSHINIFKAYFIEGLSFREMDTKEFNSINSNGNRSAKMIYWLGIRENSGVKAVFKGMNINEIVMLLKEVRNNIKTPQINYIINIFEIACLAAENNMFNNLLKKYDENYHVC